MLSIVGTGVPFVLAVALGPWIHPELWGPNGNRISLIIVLGIDVAVTSVPPKRRLLHVDWRVLHIHRAGWASLIARSEVPLLEARCTGRVSKR